MKSTVEAVHVGAAHTFSKEPRALVRLVAGLGVEGDVHAGETVKHRSRVRQDPSQPNLRQVHLLHAELHDELRARGFDVRSGDLGENVTTRGLDVLSVPRGTRLHLGPNAVVEITGLRNPCQQIEDFRAGLLAAVLDRDEHGALVRKAGVMGIVVTSGDVRPGDEIEVRFPPRPWSALERV
ncbi:MOSC domain-containing protein [Deinococcus yavapaiensis]|uniref:MOSC domain-containing protein YiiM n=1 Tax=Deinococcus yavapaiensis KR-236 TaxID=694435 RepID=A0A318S6R4_9DEIO|nr:MOSC domain-containing protein [Deinococcus yavapaiensis]PYE52739.1 MOSC domain-containing protein YiiM [Deinococcus yavapaiensis KR-236]